jgi:hypothetical protein
MFETEVFVADCLDAVAGTDGQKAVREVLARAVSDPASVLNGLGEPTAGGVQKLHVSDELTIINVVWPAWMTIMPHNHEMWAAIGIYTGREDNTFWRRVPDADGGKIEAAGARAMCVTDTAPPWRRYHPFGEQPDSPSDRRDTCIWRRFFYRTALRMGCGNLAGRSL